MEMLQYTYVKIALKGALCRFREYIQTLNFDTCNINEVKKESVSLPGHFTYVITLLSSDILQYVNCGYVILFCTCDIYYMSAVLGEGSLL